MKIVAMAVAGAAAVVALVLIVAASRWRAGTTMIRERLEAGRVPSIPAAYDARELDGVPPPVRRYLAAVLTPGQPMVDAVRLTHAGTFNTSDAGERWASFTSDQRVVTRRPGFDWEARVTMAPGLTAWVHDAYIAGEGILHVAALGLFPVMDLRGTPELARGELMRFLAESPWYPTVLLPSQGVLWAAVDDRSARATLTDGGITVTLTFHFDDQGLIESVVADARGRTVDGAVVPTPWRGRWSAYEVRDGMRIPTEGEVAWQLESGPLPYWRGRVTRIAYDFAR